MEHLRAAGDTATAITGDVVFSPTGITFQNHRSLPLHLLRRQSDFIDDLGNRVIADLYQVTSLS